MRETGKAQIEQQNEPKNRTMKRYTVTKTYKYTVTVEVEANSEREAKDLATHKEGDRNYDDYLYDCEIASEEEIEGEETDL